MDKQRLKQLAWYTGIPILAIALLVLRLHQLDGFILLQYELLLSIGYAAAVQDLKDKTVPNTIILALLACWTLTIFPQLVAGANLEHGIEKLLRAAAGFLVGGGLFLLVYLISRNGLGGGDVKFMAVAGLYLGADGILPAMLYGSIFASLFGLALILLKKIGRKDPIPLIPFLYIGIIISIFFF